MPRPKTKTDDGSQNAKKSAKRVAKPKSEKSKGAARRLTQAELNGFLEEAADKLRGNVDHSEFRGYVFALLFFKRISDVYDEEVAKLTLKLGDKEMARDPKMHLFVVPEECAWDVATRHTPTDLGTKLNETMLAIERANQPHFDGILTNKIDFNKSDEMPRDKLVGLINHFSGQKFDRAGVSENVFGDAYEYLIRNFASKAGKSSGEFYTPREVAYLMAEIVAPEQDHRVCDWASGAGGLLLQCRNYVARHGGNPDRLRLHAQESNTTTYNISRINMILHGVKGWTHRQGDSLREPKLLDDANRLLRFDRIVMNPPFSLKDWGSEEILGGADGDSYERFDYGDPPRDNGDYAWLQQVLATLEDGGRAIVVMSQGVLFRGQPEQTEEEDGRNQKADDEWEIRHGFLQDDVVEAVVVLPSKLFYGNSVPACLVVLNKSKARERKGRVALIWASRHFRADNPQNILRPSDLMRILVPWRAFADPKAALALVPQHEARLIAEEEAERDRLLQDIEDAFAPLLENLQVLVVERDRLEEEDWKSWEKSPHAAHPFFGKLLAHRHRPNYKAMAKEAKEACAARLKSLKSEVKALEKLQAERDGREKAVREASEREVAHIRVASEDLRRICGDADEAARYFALATRKQLEENEWNLNLPRYVDTFEPEEPIALPDALRELQDATRAGEKMQNSLQKLLRQMEAGR